MRYTFILIALCFSFSSYAQKEDASEMAINTQLEKWHKAAADADFDAYFNLMTKFNDFKF